RARTRPPHPAPAGSCIEARKIPRPRERPEGRSPLRPVLEIHRLDRPSSRSPTLARRSRPPARSDGSPRKAKERSSRAALARNAERVGYSSSFFFFSFLPRFLRRRILTFGRP